MARMKKGFTDNISEIPPIYEIRNKYCGVMKSLADMPPCLGGEDNGRNVA